MSSANGAAMSAAILATVPSDSSAVGNQSVSKGVALIADGVLLKGSSCSGSLRRSAAVAAAQDLADLDDFDLQAQGAADGSGPCRSVDIIDRIGPPRPRCRQTDRSRSCP